jgi:hypothetical protein
MYVERQIDNAKVQALSDTLTERMLAAEADGFRALNLEPDWPAADIAEHWS